MTEESAKHLKDIEMMSTTLFSEKLSERVTVMRMRTIDMVGEKIMSGFEVRVTTSEGSIVMYKGTNREEAINVYYECINKYKNDGFKVV